MFYGDLRNSVCLINWNIGRKCVHHTAVGPWSEHSDCDTIRLYLFFLNISMMGGEYIVSNCHQNERPVFHLNILLNSKKPLWINTSFTFSFVFRIFMARKWWITVIMRIEKKKVLSFSTKLYFKLILGRGFNGV